MDDRDEWIELVDPSTGKNYYANLKTGATSWEKKTIDAADDNDANGAAKYDSNKVETTTTPEKASGGKKKNKTGRWKECLDESSGRTYFYHTKTRETTWELPAELRAEVVLMTPQNNAVDEQKIADDLAALEVNLKAVTDTKTAEQPHDDGDDDDDDNDVVDDFKADDDWALPMPTMNESLMVDDAAGLGEGGTSEADINMLLTPTALNKEIPHMEDDKDYESKDNDDILGTSVQLNLGIGLDLGLDEDDDGYDFSSDSDFETALGDKKPELHLDEPAAIGGDDCEEADALGDLMPASTSTLGLSASYRSSMKFTATTELDPNAFNEDEIIDIETPSTIADMEFVKSEAQVFPFEEFAEAHFEIRKQWFKTETMETLSNHQSKGLKHPLTRSLTGTHASAATQCFRNITGYMGDRRSTKDWLGHVTKLLQNAFKGTEDLREEIFCQLIKQTRSNADASSERLGWKLLLICCHCFVPGQELACYLTSYICRVIEQREDEEDNIRQLAVLCLHAFRRTLEQGSRDRIPLAKEIAAIQNLRPIAVRVYLLHGASIGISIQPQTTVAQAKKKLCDLIDIPCDDSVCLAEMMRLPGFQRFTPLPDNVRIADLLTSWPEREQNLPTPALETHSNEDPLIRIVLKVNLFLRENITAKKVHPGLNAMMFIEAVNSVHEGHHKLTENEKIKLAALQLMGSYDLSANPKLTKRMISKHLHELLPEAMLREHAETDLYKGVSNALMKIGLKNMVKARRLYFENLEHLVTFGVTFFVINRISHTKKGHIEVEQAILALSQRGLLLLNPETKEVQQGYPVAELLTYGIKEDNVLMVVGTALRHRRLLFKSDQTSAIEMLLKTYFRDSPAVISQG